MSEAGRKLGACGVLRVAACVRWPRRGPAVGVQCKSGQAALAINIATTSLQCINESTKRAEPPALAALLLAYRPPKLDFSVTIGQPRSYSHQTFHATI